MAACRGSPFEVRGEEKKRRGGPTSNARRKLMMWRRRRGLLGGGGGGGGLRWRGADPAAVYGVVSSCSGFVLW